MQKIKNFISWLVTSSADSAKWSATVKGALGLAVTYGAVIPLLPGLHSVTPVDLQGGVDLAGEIVTQVALIVSAFGAVVGLFRKLYHTFVK